MVRRTIRMGFRLGLLAGLGFALFKLVKSLRGPSLSGGSEWAAPPAGTSPSGRPARETPLVETSMLNGLTLRKAQGRAAGGGGDGQSGAPSSPRDVGPHPGVEPSAAAGFPLVPETKAPVAMPEAGPPAAPQVAAEPASAPAATGDTTTEGAAANGTGKRAGAAKGAAKTRAAKVTGAAKRAAKAWVDPKGAFCPSSHPIKAKLRSGIYHLPGMLAYDRTTPDRCYQSEDGAQSDGLRKAKR